MQKIRFKNLGAPFHRSHLHVTRLKGRQSSVPHTHDFFEVFLLLEGGGIHHLNGQSLDLLPGHLFALRPEDAHWFSTTPPKDLVFVNLALSAPWWEAFHTLLGLPDWLDQPRSALLTAVDTQRVGDELIRIGHGEDPWALARTLSQVQAYLTRPIPSSADTPPGWLEDLRRELIAAPQSLGEPIAFWQKRSGRSPEHLARSCRRFYGVTFSELINQARVERARHLLRTTDEKVITIAFDCGFGNLANFHRVFARQTGRTPSRWRQEGSAAVPVHAT